ncbi:MAG: glycerophosphodiester phosphodiesterase [Candidatus Woesebacteria bacterium]|jgi:glycerophosphoryl diester phosphodiesterase
MQIIGHRGARACKTENTLDSFKEAIKLQVDWIEFDVRNTSDGETIVFHDTTLLRATGNARKISSCTYNELHTLNIDKDGNIIPSLNEAIDFIATKAKINIEIKDAHSVNNVCNVIQKQVNAGRRMSDFMVSSFSTRILHKVHTTNKSIKLALLLRLPFGFLKTDLPLYAVGFSHICAPHFAIKLAKNRGLWTYVWTVNSKSKALALSKRGIDAVVTDHAEWLK